MLCGWVNRKGMQMSLTHAHTHREHLLKGGGLGETLAGCSFTWDVSQDAEIKFSNSLTTQCKKTSS